MKRRDAEWSRGRSDVHLKDDLEGSLNDALIFYKSLMKPFLFKLICLV